MERGRSPARRSEPDLELLVRRNGRELGIVDVLDRRRIRPKIHPHRNQRDQARLDLDGNLAVTFFTGVYWEKGKPSGQRILSPTVRVTNEPGGLTLRPSPRSGGTESVSLRIVNRLIFPR